MKIQKTYQEEDKMISLIRDNYDLLQSLGSFGIHLGFGDKTVREVCEQEQVDTYTFLTVVKTIAARNGLYADFSPRPLEGRPGSGFHINMSVQGGAEALMHRAMGGILDKITDMTLFLNPTEQSYSRLGAHKAPKYISWSSNNRSQLIRVPAASGEYRRFELRSPDCTANPYLAFALLIWAGLSGIENDIALPEACNVNLHTADSRNVTLATLPKSLSDAEKCAADSNFIAQHLPQSLIEFFTK